MRTVFSKVLFSVFVLSLFLQGCTSGKEDSGVRVTGVSLSSVELKLLEGAQKQLTVIIAPREATDKTVSWASSNEGVASVSDVGVVTAVKEGVATITVTAKDGGKTAACKVTVVSAASAGIPDYSKAPGSVRLMTYNVGVFGKYMKNSISLVADLLKEAQPDIVGLNELDSCNTRHNIYQLKELNTCLGKGWNYVFQSMYEYKNGGYGIGIETPRKVLDSRSYDIPKTPGVRHMGVLAVELEDFVFMSTHLNTSGAVSLEQAKRINEYVRRDYWTSKKPVFLAGDMNSRLGSATMEELSRYWTVISVNAPTFSAKEPKNCIDFVLILNNFANYTVVKSSVCTGFRSGDVKMASDHLPVFVDVAF